MAKLNCLQITMLSIMLGVRACAQYDGSVKSADPCYSCAIGLWANRFAYMGSSMEVVLW